MKNNNKFILSMVSLGLLVFSTIMMFVIYQSSIGISECGYFERFLLSVVLLVCSIIPLLLSGILSCLSIFTQKNKKNKYLFLNIIIIIIVILALVYIFMNGIIVNNNMSCTFF